MKYSITTLVFIVFIYFNLANGKSLKSFYGNSLTADKSLRKPLASPLGNSIHDSYKRAKRQLPKGIQDFQDTLNKAKEQCAKELKMDPKSAAAKSLLYEENPTKKEKCLMACVLTKNKLMENNNKLSTKSIARIAGMVSENNPLIVSVAVATANNCNDLIKATDRCEAAYQINRCIAGEMKAHKLKLFY